MLPLLLAMPKDVIVWTSTMWKSVGINQMNKHLDHNQREPKLNDDSEDNNKH